MNADRQSLSSPSASERSDVPETLAISRRSRHRASTPRTSTRVAWAFWCGAIAALLTTGVLSALTGASYLARLPTAATFTLAFATVGALVITRHPANAVGRVCLGIGCVFALTLLSVSYTDYSVQVHEGTLPGTAVTVWLGGWMWFASLAPVALVLALFPNGHPPTRRWRAVVWLIAAGALTLIVVTATDSGKMTYADRTFGENPAGITALAPVSGLLVTGALIALAAGIAGSILSVVVRFRRSRGVERQQMKWLASVATLVVASFVWIIMAEEIPAVANVPVLASVRYTLLTGALAGVPLAIGVAILRHNLYDIDRIINRALVYAVLTATLIAVYLTVVLGLGMGVRMLTGGDSPVVIATSTLIVAAAFRPLRSRIQSGVDRRFYRRRYDSARTVEQFTSRMRDVIDLQSLDHALATTVYEAMQPAHVSLWLRTSFCRSRLPMRARIPAWIAGTLWLTSAAALSGMYVVATLRDGWAWYERDLVEAAAGPLILVTPTVGALVATRRARNPIGWILCLVGVAITGAFFASTLYPPGTQSVPVAGRWLALVTEILTPVALLSMLTFLLLLFPTGKLVSPRWRVVAWLAGGLILGLSLNTAFGVQQIWSDPVVRNPVYLPAVEAILAPAGLLVLLLTPAVVLASLASLAVRFRRSHGVERRQMKWFVYAAGLEVTVLLAVLALSYLNASASLVTGILYFYGVWVGLPVGIPLVVGIAILRHNLFDIDRIINRALVYLALTMTLGGCYLSLIVGLGGLLRAVSGSSNAIVTATSTLAVAGLFQPLRRLIQNAVDRRFYRSRYDATQTIDAFSTRLRDQIDLTSLSDELRRTVTTTMQPASISVWLRPSAHDHAR